MMNLQFSLACRHCELAWSDWSSCENGQRKVSQYILHSAVGAGDKCETPEERVEGKVVLSIALNQ